MDNSTIHPEHTNCRGCQFFEDIDGAMTCLNLCTYEGGTPENPPCYRHDPAFLAAVDECLRLVETLGAEHPETKRAIAIGIGLAPPPLIDEMHAMADSLGLIPKACGYLADNQPMFRLDDIAAKLGITQEEAAATLHDLQAEREARGLSNAGVVTDLEHIHQKH